jgi:arylsulfatase A-like enzyme
VINRLLKPFLALLAMAFASPAMAQEARPNIVLILVDDAALMDFGVYGGEAHTPNIDALAARGALFTQHRTTPFCAPSRAMLLTGMDHHTAGLGTIREVLPKEHRGQPGYTMALEPGVITLAERLKAGGYRTYMTGKWHLGHEDGQLPIDHGFDRSFLVDASGADNWEDQPYLPYYRTAPWFKDRKPATLPEDFYSSTFLVDQMIDYLEADAGSADPFLAYVAFLAIHIPVQAPREYTDRYVETYAAGWQAIREARWQRAQEIGLVGQGAPLAPAAGHARRLGLGSTQRRGTSPCCAQHGRQRRHARGHGRRIRPAHRLSPRDRRIREHRLRHHLGQWPGSRRPCGAAT